MKLYKFLAVLIIVSGLFLRLWNFQNLFYYAIDEEKAAYIIKGIIDFSHFPTVGYPSSIGFRLGPLLYYLVAPFYKLFGPYPYVLGYLSVAASSVSMLLIYKMHKFIGKGTSLLALIFYAFSYLNILYDRRGWPVSFHSLIALTILYSLLNLRKNKKLFSIPLTIALIAATHFEVATILFIPLTIICFFVLKIKIPKKLILFCIFLFFLSHLGLLIFDVRHNFLNTKYLLNYFKKDSSERIAQNIPLTGIRTVYFAHNLIPSTFARTIFSASPNNVAIQYANCPQYLKYKQSLIPSYLKFIVILVFISFAVHTIKNWHDKSQLISTEKIIFCYFLLLFINTTIYTYVFQGEIAEYYMLSGFAYFFILLGILFRKIPQRLTLIIFPFIFLFIIYNSYQMLISFNPYGWENKLEAVTYALSQIDNKPFILDSFQTCWSTGGYRYLFNLMRKEPLRSYMDQNLSEYYTPDNLLAPKYRVSILAPELVGDNPLKFNEYREKLINNVESSKKFGAIEVYISKL